MSRLLLQVMDDPTITLAASELILSNRGGDKAMIVEHHRQYYTGCSIKKIRVEGGATATVTYSNGKSDTIGKVLPGLHRSLKGACPQSTPQDIEKLQTPFNEFTSIPIPVVIASPVNNKAMLAWKVQHLSSGTLHHGRHMGRL